MFLCHSPPTPGCHGPDRARAVHRLAAWPRLRLPKRPVNVEAGHAPFRRSVVRVGSGHDRPRGPIAPMGRPRARGPRRGRPLAWPRSARTSSAPIPRSGTARGPSSDAHRHRPDQTPDPPTKKIAASSTPARDCYVLPAEDVVRAAPVASQKRVFDHDRRPRCSGAPAPQPRRPAGVLQRGRRDALAGVLVAPGCRPAGDSTSLPEHQLTLIPGSASVAPATSTACGTSSSAAATRSASAADSPGRRDRSTATDSSRSNRPTATGVPCPSHSGSSDATSTWPDPTGQEPGQLPLAPGVVEDQQPAVPAPQRGEQPIRRLLGAVGRRRQAEGLGQLRQPVGNQWRVRRRDPPGDVVLAAPPVRELDHRGRRAQARRPAGGTQHREPAVPHRGVHRRQQPAARRGVLVAARDVPRDARRFRAARPSGSASGRRRALWTAPHASTPPRQQHQADTAATTAPAVRPAPLPWAPVDPVRRPAGARRHPR